MTSKTLLFLLTSLAIACSDRSAPSPLSPMAPDASTTMQTLVGKSLAETVSSLALDERGFRYTDEPPAKLKMIAVSPEQGTEIEIHLHYDSALLFSADRNWPLSRIGAAKVLGLVRRRGTEREVFGEIHSALSRP